MRRATSREAAVISPHLPAGHARSSPMGIGEPWSGRRDQKHVEWALCLSCLRFAGRDRDSLPVHVHVGRRQGIRGLPAERPASQLSRGMARLDHLLAGGALSVVGHALWRPNDVGKEGHSHNWESPVLGPVGHEGGSLVLGPHSCTGYLGGARTRQRRRGWSCEVAVWPSRP